MELSVIVPTFNEGPNVAPLVERVFAATTSFDAEIVFVDDSIDDTPQIIAAIAEASGRPVTLIHRGQPTGGLGGAVVEGIRAARSDVCIVMDGDLQHPPEVIPSLIARAEETGADVVAASRYTGGGSASGLSDKMRVAVSRASTAVTKAMFPIRLRESSDPMTGFFLVRRSSVDWENLHPRGFKILLEILARQHLRVAEVPFDFADRAAGESKASLRQGWRFITQLAALRFGKMSLFAVIGALGAVANVLIMALLTWMGMGYVWAAIIAAETTIIGNFILFELLVFRDMRDKASGLKVRFAKSFAFNNAEAVVRITLLWVLVNTWHISSVLVNAVTLILAFIVRFVFHSLVVYAPTKEKEARVPAE